MQKRQEIAKMVKDVNEGEQLFPVVQNSKTVRAKDGVNTCWNQDEKLCYPRRHPPAVFRWAVGSSWSWWPMPTILRHSTAFSPYLVRRRHLRRLPNNLCSSFLVLPPFMLQSACHSQVSLDSVPHRGQDGDYATPWTRRVEGREYRLPSKYLSLVLQPDGQLTARGACEPAPSHES